jgi:3-oxoacyl-[acyl-carrier protein] reductase
MAGRMINELNPEKVAIVTGASSGIGRATAIALAGQGVRLALLGRSVERLGEVAAAAADAGSAGVMTCVSDLCSEESVCAAVASVQERYGEVDILINNAGLSLNGEVDGYALSDWQTVIETNLTGPFLLCREVLPGMKRQRGGQIINVASGAGRNGIKNMAAYCASKFGLIGFTESLGHEVRPWNIRVSALLPGSVATDFFRVANRLAEGADGREARSAGYAMLPEEVASVILSMLLQPPQAWMSEVVLRPLNLELTR